MVLLKTHSKITDTFKFTLHEHVVTVGDTGGLLYGVKGDLKGMLIGIHRPLLKCNNPDFITAHQNPVALGTLIGNTLYLYTDKERKRERRHRRENRCESKI